MACHPGYTRIAKGVGFAECERYPGSGQPGAVELPAQGRGQVKSRTCTGQEADMGSLVLPTRATTLVPSLMAK